MFMVLKYNDFLLEKMGYPDNIDYYVSEIYKYCLEELNKYMKFSGRWYSYKKSFIVTFDESEKNKDFSVNEVNIDFLISVRKRNLHEFGTAGFYPYTKEDDITEDGININLDIELCIQSEMESVNIHNMKLELMKSVRHEMLHAYESYKKEILKGKPDNIWMNDYHMMNKDFTLGSNSLIDFLYLLYFAQAGERNAHIAQVFKNHYKDVNETIDRLINFNYLKEYLNILREIKQNGYDEDDLSHVIRKLVSDYNDFCEDQKIEPLPKMVRLENKGLLKWMKHYSRIFKDQGLKMKKKLGKRIVEAINYDKILLDSYGIKNYTINDDGIIDVDGDVEILYEHKFSDTVKRNGGKIPFKFGRVTGDFAILGADLKSLEGCPYYVGGTFRCNDNKLKNLKGSPEEVGGLFFCNHNELESLEGMPLEIGGSFVCWSNKELKEFDSISYIGGLVMCDVVLDLTKFKGYCKGFKILSDKKWIDKSLNESFKTDNKKIYVSGYEKSKIIKKLKTFHIIEDTFSDNYTINDDGTVDINGDVYLRNRNLTEIPFNFGKVTGNFFCLSNNLKSLKGCPYYVGGNFSCSHNELKNLIGSPEEVFGNFECQNNDLNSVEGMSLEIGGHFICYDNPDLTEFDSISNIEGNIYCNTSVDFSKFKGYTNSIEY